MKKICLALMLWMGFVIYINAQVQPEWILPVKERNEWIDNMLAYRIDSLLPKLMKRTEIDMWILISREYNEDPVMKTMLPSSWISARRRTIFVFSQDENYNLEKVAIARYSVGKLLPGGWDIDVYPDQWEALVEYIEKRNPKKIGVNISDDFGLADGMVHTEYKTLMDKLSPKFKERVTSAQDLAIAWLETRSPIELEIYPKLCKIGHGILQEAFSSNVITAGKTTSEDVIWWLRQRVVELGLSTWFHPTVSIQRKDEEKFDHLRSFTKRPGQQIIKHGDLLHVDFGITYLRLNTDQQQHFYMLHPGEKTIPEYLSKAFKKANRVQDILTESFATNKTGNQVLADALAQCKKENIIASIYTHPIGFHGHAAGPTIGMWDNQGPTLGRGDYPLFFDTAYSIELNASSEIKEWGKIIRIMLEEDGVYSEKGFYYPNGRAEQIFAIPRMK